MNIGYCNDSCKIGQAASKECLESNNSAFDAALDFRFFVENCFKTCPYKDQPLVKEKH